MAMAFWKWDVTTYFHGGRLQVANGQVLEHLKELEKSSPSSRKKNLKFS
jgi:hypothetical protein